MDRTIMTALVMTVLWMFVTLFVWIGVKNGTKTHADIIKHKAGYLCLNVEGEVKFKWNNEKCDKGERAVFQK